MPLVEDGSSLQQALPQTEWKRRLKRLQQAWEQHSLLAGSGVLAVFVLLLAGTVLLQWLGGAYGSEFGGYPDESAHFITGLMLRDYIAAGCPAPPVEYAEHYYLHYPKVAFGMWGPLLHVAEAGWILLFSPSRVSMLVLMAVITASLALLLYRSLVSTFGAFLALTAALLFVALRPVQAYTGMLMADGLVALWDFAAAMAFARYMDTRAPKYSIQFGVLVCLSIMTKGNGAALVLLPAFAILLTRKFDLIRHKYAWLGPALIGCIAGPWQYYSAKALNGILERQPGWVYLPDYTRSLLTYCGLALMPLIALGVYRRVIAPMRDRSIESRWAAAAALICSVWLFHCLIPAPGFEPRYMIAVAPPLLMFLVAGIDDLAVRIRVSRIPVRRRAWSLAVIVWAVFLTTSFSIPKKYYHGFDEVAELLEKPDYKDSVILVSSEADGEGMLISEVATREKRPSHVVLRATKMLSQSNWAGEHYVLFYKTPAELMRFLKDVPVAIVVIHNERGLFSFPHHALLKETIAAFPEEWEHVGTYPQRRHPTVESSIDVYRMKSVPYRPSGPKFRIPLPYTLGHSIEP
jgi:hypothetical protein